MNRRAHSTPQSDAPALSLYLTDVTRAAAEYGMLMATRPLQQALPRGDGHHVVVLPGLGTTDVWTRSLRHLLRELGYTTHGWGLGRNIGPTAHAVDGMRRCLDKVHQDHGAPVSIVGWSLGGIFGRDLARRTPDSVRQVITLGSPFRLARHSQSRASQMFDRFAHLHVENLQLPLERDAGALPVPTTSVYSRYDGIVAPEACLNLPGPQAENVRVMGSHMGMVHNPAVLYVIADRLAQSAGTWRPFQPPAGARAFYRTDDAVTEATAAA